MNFIFISPQFPKTYWNFCDRLKNKGVCAVSYTHLDVYKRQS